MSLLFLKNTQYTELLEAATWKPEFVCSDCTSMKAENPCVGAYSPISIVSMDAAQRDVGAASLLPLVSSLEACEYKNNLTRLSIY